MLLFPEENSTWFLVFLPSFLQQETCVSSLMLKGTSMVRTGVWMWPFMPLNIRAHTQQSGPTWSSSVAQASESVTSQAVRSGVKHRKLYGLEVSIFTGASHAALMCHKSNFFNCSYVTKKMIFQGPSLNQFGQNPLYRAKNPSFFHVCNRQSRVPV